MFGNATLSVGFSLLSLQGKMVFTFPFIFGGCSGGGGGKIPLASLEEDKNTSSLLCDGNVGNFSFRISAPEEAS